MPARPARPRVLAAAAAFAASRFFCGRRLGLGFLLLEIGDLILQADDVGMLARELRLELGEVGLELVDLLQSLDHLRRGVRVLRPGNRVRIVETFEKLLALLDEANLLLAVQPQLRVHALERGEVDADLLRQLSRVLRRVHA